MRFKTLYFFLAILITLSCNQTDNKKVNNSGLPAQEKNPENFSIIQLDDRLAGADSLVFVFYKDPHGKDSLRYTRFYKQYATIDSALINFVKSNLEGETTRFERIKKCRSEGKIWCFTNGEIFQTVYFSSFDNVCSFLYIIKNGQFYYSSISEGMALKLKEMQKKAIDPTLEPR